LKVELVAVIVRTVCTSLSFCFAFMCFQAIDFSLKRQLAALAAFSLIVGIGILVSLTIFLRIETMYPGTGDQQQIPQVSVEGNKR
jgi:hypothetical protein